jgi:catalase
VDTQLTRLGGPNFHEIPINASVAQVHNNQRDGFHRQAIARGRVAYEPNSLAGGCPFQAGPAGFMSFPEPVQEHKVRGKPEKFAEHYNQATLFWNSQSEVEKAHIVRAYRFELTKVQTLAVRMRMVAGLRNVDEELASRVARGLGVELPEPLPKVMERGPRPEVKASKALSLLVRPGTAGITTRRIAILVADGIEDASVTELHRLLTERGAVPRFVGITLGKVEGATGNLIDVEVSMETSPSVLYDALVLPDGDAGVTALGESGHALEFIKDQYRHCKPILVLGAAQTLLEAVNIPLTLPDGAADTGLLQFSAQDSAEAGEAFAAAIAQHRHFARETDPPLI